MVALLLLSCIDSKFILFVRTIEKHYYHGFSSVLESILLKVVSGGKAQTLFSSTALIYLPDDLTASIAVSETHELKHKRKLFAQNFVDIEKE